MTELLLENINLCDIINMGVDIMESIYSKTIDDLEEFFVDMGEKKFKATQVFEWLYIKKISNFKDMTNIKKSVIE